MKQSERGESLANQERAFAQFIENNGWERVRSYAESASGKDVNGRETFRAMLDDLEELRVDVVLVDTLDRFTRSLRDGLNLLEQLRGRRVGLVAVDWGRTAPMNLDDDRDWADLVGEFTAAERERRRIRSRVLKSYEGRRAAGRSTANTAAFGLVRTKDGAFVPDLDTVHIVHEVDRRFARGETLEAVFQFARSMHGDAWGVINGVRAALVNEQYVRAGVRSPEMQGAIIERFAVNRGRFGQRRKHQHEFSGVFVCGKCVDLGYGPEDSLMFGKLSQPNEKRGYSGGFNIACAHGTARDRRHPAMEIRVSKIEPAWISSLAVIADPSWIARWAKADDDTAVARVRTLHRRLAAYDEQAERLKDRRDSAIDLYSSLGPAYRSQVAKTLGEVDADEKALVAQREATLGEIARAPHRARDPAKLRGFIERIRDLYELMDAGERNALNRALCATLGSHPIVRRDGTRGSRWNDARVSWPEIEGRKAPAAAARTRRASESSRRQAGAG